MNALTVQAECNGKPTQSSADDDDVKGARPVGPDPRAHPVRGRRLDDREIPANLRHEAFERRGFRLAEAFHAVLKSSDRREETSTSDEPTRQHKAIDSPPCPASTNEIEQPTSEPVNIARQAHNKDAIRRWFG